MIKLEVLENEHFTLTRFKEIKNLQRKKQDVDGKLNEGDTFECEKDLADYLLGKNAYNKAFVKIIEVIQETPKIENVEKIMWEKENGKVVASNYDEAETKIKVKKTTKKKTSKK